MKFYSQETLNFLIAVKENNSKEWFEAHRKEYEKYVIEPSRFFVQELDSLMFKIDQEFELAPKINKTISRIQRDTRFSKDKRLYKDKLWITFKKRGRSNTDYPTYFFELSPESFRYGMGFFKATPKTMDSLRTAIDENESSFYQLINEIETNKNVVLEGEMYKKNKYLGTNELVKNWYNRKNIYVVHNDSDVAKLFKKTFYSELKKDFSSFSKLYDYFVEILKKEAEA